MKQASFSVGNIFMLLNDFKARGLRSILTPPMMALTEFFHADTETNVHLYQYEGILILFSYGSIYVLVYISYLFSATVSSGNWFTQVKVLTLNVIMWMVFLHLNNFVLDLIWSSVADFFNSGVSRMLPPQKKNLVYLCKGQCDLDI